MLELDGGRKHANEIHVLREEVRSYSHAVGSSEGTCVIGNDVNFILLLVTHQLNLTDASRQVVLAELLKAELPEFTLAILVKPVVLSSIPCASEVHKPHVVATRVDQFVG